MSELFEQLVRARGISEQFLTPQYDDCVDPFLLPDAEKAINRIKKAIEQREKILIYGDYDVDGVTASVVMYDGLKMAGAGKIEIMLPDRFTDGYGMSKKVIQYAKESGVSLVITVDCGSGNKDIVEALSDENIDTIVTDHHECPDELPDAIAVVNPKRKDIFSIIAEWDKYTKELMDLRELAGVGVAFTLIRGLVKAGMIQSGREKWLLDLVVIGTLCDSMRITGENRRLTYFGMVVLKKTQRPGLREMIRSIGVKKISSNTIGFQIGPRLNAAGRMETATKALDLLMAKNRADAARMVAELDRLNEERKNQQKQAVKEIKEKGEAALEPVIVVAGDWHEGILGIIAGRLVEDYKKPAFVFTMKDGEYKGSGRSFGDFNLAEALAVCKEEIIGGGGHAGACGVKVAKDKMDIFKEKVNEYYRDLSLFDQEQFLEENEDLEINFVGDLTVDFLDEINRLEPYGAENEMPVFLLRSMYVVDARKMGTDEQHMRMLVRDRDGAMLKMVAFNAPRKWLQIKPGEKVDAWIHVEENEWNGLRSAEGRILKMTLAQEEYF